MRLLAILAVCLAILANSATAQVAGDNNKSVFTSSPKLPPKAGKFKAVGDMKFESELKLVLRNKTIGNFSNISSTKGPNGEKKKYGAKLKGKVVDKKKNNKKKPFSLDGKVKKKIVGRESPKATGSYPMKLKDKFFKGDVDRFGKLKVRQSPDIASMGDVSVREISNGNFEIRESLELLTEASRDGNTYGPAVGGAALFQLIPIPEPAAGLMFALGCYGLGAFLRGNRARPEIPQ